MADNSAKQRLVRFLAEVDKKVHDCEERASRIDPASGDQNAFRALMLEKATLLKELEEKSARLVEEYAEEAAMLGPQEVALAETVGATVRRFSKGANTALKLDSVFYMSALLYPDEHRKGEPNNLERLIAELE